MSRWTERWLLAGTDFIMIHAAFFLWMETNGRSFSFAFEALREIIPVSAGIYIFWLVLFGFFGLYRSFILSRTDELINLIKTVTLGVFIIFLLTFDIEKGSGHPLEMNRYRVLIYWCLMWSLTGAGRMVFRTVVRKLLEKGVGRRKALIVGAGRNAGILYHDIQQAPALGYEVAGFVQTAGDPVAAERERPVLGTLSRLHEIIEEESIQVVLIAVTRKSVRLLEEIVSQCDGLSVSMKIVPDLYDVIVGQARTHQIYGFPLIEIFPQLMQPWERAVKRLIDIVFSMLILVGFLPLWIVVALIIPLDSKGPVFYLQERVGRGGRVYKMIKFRSMVQGAEKMTGPVWATYNDPRVTRFGRFLRRFRLDEIPQLVNVLKGDMSWVGPRPERPYFVRKFQKEIPLYSRRLRVRPGITGWAQVMGQYDQSLEHVKQKLAYDLFYLENMSVRMDLKIVLNTLYVMLSGSGFEKE